MATRVQGRLDEQDYSDTYTIWRQPGAWAYQLLIRGAGTAALRLEVVDSGAREDGAATDGWRVIDERSSIPGGARLEGMVVVPEVVLGLSERVGWAQLRLRISRGETSGPVEYDFSLDGGP